MLGAPEILFSPAAMLAGLMEQARIGESRWNGQSDAPVWQLYLETLVQGLGWPALGVAIAGGVALAIRRPLVLVATVAVPIVCLAVMLRQELFFARFALPLLPPLAMLAGVGTIALARFGVLQSGTKPVWVAILAALVLVVQLLPEIAQDGPPRSAGDDDRYARPGATVAPTAPGWRARRHRGVRSADCLGGQRGAAWLSAATHLEFR